ncbi:cyclic di-AMP binding protein CbpA [Periweissella ghanensis]|uniref:cyclic di-AMP binding protein CbpA n=1 Tax=Periweissella ghanensis TaxID=467997 RepID=UPI001E655C76|nr:cyclic di-AMP binding protein CbpA [Periweissella ghanensis]MCM0600496.1 CBS domain-containing protein [Periweissella ghanensis]
MLDISFIKPKQELTIVHENTTIAEALDIFENSNFRAIPILDTTGELFRGNIYKMHVYRHMAENGNMDLPVTTLMRNSTKFINLDAAFYSIFFAIRDLPYIAVLDHQNHFYGILTHASLMESLSTSWNVDRGSYVLRVRTPGQRGDLQSTSKVISKYTDIEAVMTSNSHPENKSVDILFTLPVGLENSLLQKIIRGLQRKGYPVVEIEDLHN